MALSNFTDFPGDIPDPSNATPGLFNARFSNLSRNLDQLNADSASSLTALDNRRIGAGQALTGGGDLSSDRTLDANVSPSDETVVGVTRRIGGGSGINSVGDLSSDRTISVDEANVDHDSLNNFVANEHIDHSGVRIEGGNALTGSGDLTSTNTLDVATDGIQTDELDLSIAPTWTGTHQFNSDMTLGMPTQNYLVTGDGSTIAVQSQGAGSSNELRFYTADLDGTDSMGLRFFPVADSIGGFTNFEALDLIYQNSGPRYDISSRGGGTGAANPIHIRTDGSDAAIFRTDQAVAFPTGVRINGTGASNFSLEQAGGNYAHLGAPGSQPTTADMDNGSIVMWLDESNGNLVFENKSSAGTLRSKTSISLQ